MSSKKLMSTIALLAMLFSVSTVFAQGRPGIDRPIRVGQFKGTGTNNAYWHENIHTSSAALTAILENPNGTNLGADLVVPTHNPPFTFATFGLASGSGTPSAAQTNAFIAALDTLDVAIISCMVAFESVISTAAQRDALVSFARRKGYMAIHATTDSRGTWAAGDSLVGTRFRNHPSAPDRTGTLRRDSTFQTDSSWNFLNRSLFGNGLDTTFVEEWFYFTTTGAAIRSQANLKPTIQLVESSVSGSNPPVPMGDHPMAWYRTYPDSGGRTFYTAIGHRPNLWNTATNQPRFARRQYYNAILWLAKYDSLSTVVAVKHTKAPGRASDYSKLAVSPSALTVTMTRGGNHEVELMTLDGKRVARQTGAGQNKAYNFTGLRSGVYALTVATLDGRANRLVTVP
jgi:hypothetical protein